MRRWLAVVVLGVVAAALLVTVVRGEPTGGPTWRLLQVNLCGHANSTPTGCRGDGHDPEAWILRVAAAVHRQRPSVVTVNEACRGQLDRLVGELRRRGWVVSARFTATVIDANLACTGPKEYGNAVLVRGEVRGEARRHDLATSASPEHPYERRAMICATVEPIGAPRPLVACSAHILPVGFDSAEHDRQLGLLAGAVRREREAGLPLVVGGDLNSTPDVVHAALPGLRDVPDGWSAPGTYHGKKFDYLLISDDLGERRRLDAVTIPASDHRGLVLELSAEDERG